MILPFGSFASGIMLFVIAFAYILYFGAYTLNKTIKGDKDTVSKEQEYIAAGKSSITTSHTYYYKEPVNDNQDTCQEKGDNFSFKEQSVSRVIKIPDIQVTPTFKLFSLFSRPPPFST